MGLAAKVMTAAHEIIKERGLINLSRFEVCERAGISPGSFTHVMGKTFGEFVFDLHGAGMSTGLPEKRKRVLNIDLRRRSILDAALNLTLKHGLHSLTMRKVADAAGVSIHPVQQIFKTKQNLINDIIETAREQGISPALIEEWGKYATESVRRT